MAAERNEKQRAAVRHARSLITEAMDLLDACGASKTAAAHLALAIEELRQDEGQPPTA